MTKEEMQFRNNNIRRLRRIGTPVEDIRAFYNFAEGSKSCKRVYEIADWYWRDNEGTYPQNVPIEEREAIKWLRTNDHTMKVFKKVGLPGVYSSTGPMGQTLSGRQFQSYFMLSDVERLLGEWDTILDVVNRVHDLTNTYIRNHLSEIRCISALEGGQLFWKGNHVQHVIKTASAIECKRGKPDPKPKPKPVQDELPMKVTGAGGNHIVEYVLKVLEALDIKGHRRTGKGHLQCVMLRNPGLNRLIECNISPGEVAFFLNCAEQDPPHSPFPDEHVRALLSNSHLCALIAMDARIQDEDTFYKEWKFSGQIGFWIRKR